ncbi:ester cyclase [Paraburkholderia sp. LEh10]|uniref:ester cyclase n=1 Tax=Paraburkholderia sp. LEh10 TaxID=2821353 RepID=UPI001AE66D91|nr:ester cyclase [Paraburkholderia sp. LEh10]MBP0595736.1 ester cyclase [Paraburkholderia sp. LEh10]
MTHAISEDIAHTTIKAFYLTEKDVDLLRQVVTPDWEYIPEPPGAKPGADQMADAFERMAIALPDMEITILDLLIHGDRVGVRAEVTGTQSGELLGMASSAKQIKFAIHSFHQLRGPLVAKTWHLEDRISVFGQIGQLPKHLDAHPI